MEEAAIIVPQIPRQVRQQTVAVQAVQAQQVTTGLLTEAAAVVAVDLTVVIQTVATAVQV